MKKTAKFKQLLKSGHVDFFLEAHNALSAKIVEEAGFGGVWASGLSISATLGVRDSNEASWTQLLEILEFMSDVTSIPILFDADTGFGNFNNTRRLVKKLEQRDISAMCIEDKLFPKTNSLLGGVHQPLAKVNEFSGKIKAAKDTQVDPDFCVIARIEAFIAGFGLDEVIERALAYQEAGADAILVHSKLSKPDQILSFMSEWQNTCPVVIVPTTYSQTATQVFVDAGVSIVIWANHLIRASINAMQQIASKIHREQGVNSISQEIVTVEEIFRLQNVEELISAEHRYLPNSDSKI